MNKIIAVGAVCAIATMAMADTVTFDFDTDLNAAGTTAATIGTLSATHGLNTAGNSAEQMSRAWYERDAANDAVFFVSARSFTRKAADDGVEPSLDMTLGAPSYVSFTMDAGAGNVLDFAGSTLTVDAMGYADGTFGEVIYYKAWANVGGTWTPLDVTQSHTADATGATTKSVMFADAAKTNAINGWALTSNVADTAAPFSFDISALAAGSQSVELAIAISGTRDNHGNWGASMDNIAVNDFAVAPIPEPATLGLFAAVGGAMLFIRRRRQS